MATDVNDDNHNAEQPAPADRKVTGGLRDIFIRDLHSILSDISKLWLEFCIIFKIPFPPKKQDEEIEEFDEEAYLEEQRIKLETENLQAQEKEQLLNDLKKRFDLRRATREQRLEWLKSKQEQQEEQFLPKLSPEELPPLPSPEQHATLPYTPMSEAATDIADDATSDPAQKRLEKGYALSTEYHLPELDLLTDMEDDIISDPEEVKQKKEILQNTLDSFSIDAQVVGTTVGPRVTLFEIEPAIGVKVESIAQISNNIAMDMRATSIRVLTPVPGYRFVGVEVPNRKQVTVCMRKLLASNTWQDETKKIPLVLGRNISGHEIILDLAEAPHLLIAGATGSGKSVCLNSMLVSLLYRFNPVDLRLILVDPKIVEFSLFKKLPHLIVPVVTETKKVVSSLRWILKEMEERYQILSQVGARNLATYNSRSIPEGGQFDEQGNRLPDRLPFIVVVIDELADIMMTARAEVETSLARIAQLSRAVGIHTIIATQRPSVDVLTGVIKANYPTRIAFQVSSQFDSRTILDGKGAETLLGRGDMLYRAPRAVQLQRIQSPMVLDDDLEKVIDAVSSQADQQFDLDIFNTIIKEEQEALQNQDFSDKDEALIQQAIEIIIRDRKASTSYIQRCLRIGYNRAATIIEILEERGIIGPQVGSSRREILVDQYDFD